MHGAATSPTKISSDSGLSAAHGEMVRSWYRLEDKVHTLFIPHGT